MKSWLTRILINWVGLMIVAGLFARDFHLDGVDVALLAALILSMVNAIVKPILVVLTLPITILSLGLFLFVINAFTLLITAHFISGFEISSFGYALLAAIVMSLLNFLIQKIILK